MALADWMVIDQQWPDDEDSELDDELFDLDDDSTFDDDGIF